MAIVASAHVLLAGLLLPAVPSVVRVTEPAASGREEVADATVVTTLVDAMTTIQLAVVLPPVKVHVGHPTNLPCPLVFLAVAVPFATFALSLLDALLIV